MVLTEADGGKVRSGALVGRVGLGSNTRSIGLGEMGSELASAFEEAFFDYPDSYWNADWKQLRFAELKAPGLPFVSARAGERR